MLIMGAAICSAIWEGNWPLEKRRALGRKYSVTNHDSCTEPLVSYCFKCNFQTSCGTPYLQTSRRGKDCEKIRMKFCLKNVL